MKFIKNEKNLKFFDKVLIDGKIRTVVGYNKNVPTDIVVLSEEGWDHSATSEDDCIHPSVLNEHEFWYYDIDEITVLNEFNYEIF